MKWIKNLIALIVTIAVIVFGFLLAVDNPAPTTVAILTLQSPVYPLFAWLISVFLVGVAVGFTACFIGFVRGKNTQRKLRRELEQNRSELHQLRTMSLHD